MAASPPTAPAAAHPSRRGGIEQGRPSDLGSANAVAIEGRRMGKEGTPVVLAAVQVGTRAFKATLPGRSGTRAGAEEAATARAKREASRRQGLRLMDAT